jgi:hypothetical protein
MPLTEQAWHSIIEARIFPDWGVRVSVLWLLEARMRKKFIETPAVHAVDHNGIDSQTDVKTIPQNPAKSRKNVSRARAKKLSGSLHIPVPQQIRIQNRYLMGQSIRKIAREEDRDWTTIAKVLMKSSEQMQAYIEEQRAKLFVLTSDAVDVIRKGLKRGNLEMAYKFLIDTGVMPQQAMVHAAGSINAQPEQLSQDALTEKELGKVIQMAIQRAHDYDLPSDSIQMRPPKNEITVAEKSS